jgi:NTE family protein
MDALVLGGGSVRGAYQAGAIRAVLESGFEPKLITTISVGSINGMFLSNFAGKQKVKAPTQQVDFKIIGEQIWDLWLKEIEDPSDIISKRNIASLIWALARKKFNGFYDNKPLKKLVSKYIEDRYLSASPIDIYSGTVDLDMGRIIYADKTCPEYIQYAIASSAIPLAMPPSIIRHKPHADGGMVDSAPLAESFKHGASNIICIANSPKYIGAKNVEVGRPVHYIERCLDIMLNNTLNNDIREAKLINNIAPEDGSPISDGRDAGKKRIPLEIIRPYSPINIDITDFDTYDIHNMLELGYENAKKTLFLK